MSISWEFASKTLLFLPAIRGIILDAGWKKERRNKSLFFHSCLVSLSHTIRDSEAPVLASTYASVMLSHRLYDVAKEA
jgi:hypothetical protein